MERNAMASLIEVLNGVAKEPPSEPGDEAATHSCGGWTAQRRGSQVVVSGPIQAITLAAITDTSRLYEWAEGEPVERAG